MKRYHITFNETLSHNLQWNLFDLKKFIFEVHNVLFFLNFCLPFAKLWGKFIKECVSPSLRGEASSPYSSAVVWHLPHTGWKIVLSCCPRGVSSSAHHWLRYCWQPAVNNLPSGERPSSGDLTGKLWVGQRWLVQLTRAGTRVRDTRRGRTVTTTTTVSKNCNNNNCNKNCNNNNCNKNCNNNKNCNKYCNNNNNCNENCNNNYFPTVTRLLIISTTPESGTSIFKY